MIPDTRQRLEGALQDLTSYLVSCRTPSRAVSVIIKHIGLFAPKELIWSLQRCTATSSAEGETMSDTPFVVCVGKCRATGERNGGAEGGQVCNRQCTGSVVIAPALLCLAQSLLTSAASDFRLEAFLVGAQL